MTKCFEGGVATLLWSKVESRRVCGGDVVWKKVWWRKMWDDLDCVGEDDWKFTGTLDGENWERLDRDEQAKLDGNNQGLGKTKTTNLDYNQ